MASEKSAKTPAVLDFNTQSQGLALEGAQRQDNAKPPPREWNAPSSNKERDSHAGTRSKQRYERWDGPRGRQRSPGRHWEKTWDQSRPHESHWERSWNQPSSFGNSRGKNSWESNGNSKGNDKLTLEQPAQGIDERIRKDSKLTELKLNPHRNKDTTVFRLTRTDENDDERILPTEGGRSEMGKERETRFSLTSGRTRWQRPVDTTSHGEQHSFTSLSENRNHTNFRWTRNPT